jgi:AcrR family transcriptional regulator
VARPSRKGAAAASARDQAGALPNNPREAILSAALKAFARDGFNGASMPAIAKMAQVAPTLIHYYFGSKENLWRETVDYSLGALRRDALAIGHATRALAPLDRLRALLQTLARHAARWPDHFVMITAEARSESDRYAWVLENYTGVIFEEIVHTLQDAKDIDLIDDISIEQLTFLLVGGLLVYFTINPRMPKDPGPDELDRTSGEYTDMMFHLLMHGIVKDGRGPDIASGEARNLRRK